MFCPALIEKYERGAMIEFVNNSHASEPNYLARAYCYRPS